MLEFCACVWIKTLEQLLAKFCAYRQRIVGVETAVVGVPLGKVCLFVQPIALRSRLARLFLRNRVVENSLRLQTALREKN